MCTKWKCGVWVPGGYVDYIPIEIVEYALMEMLRMYQVEMLNMITKWKC